MFDLRYAVRTLFRSPTFTAVSVLTLALGIGATTAIFSIVHAVLIEPLPYRDSKRLVVTRLSLPDYADVQQMSRSFEGMAVWASNLYTVERDEQGRQVRGGVISGDLLPLLGVMPVVGRNFSADDERQRTVILGNGLWQSLFAGDPSVVGRTLRLSGASYTVVGVVPPGFRFPSGDFELWTPIGLLRSDAKAQAENRALRIFTAVGRLRPGVTIADARHELEAISATLARTYPLTNADVTLSLESLTDRLVGDVRRPLLVIFATVALLLLIACANVANLMLARTSARAREMAVRAALGAGRRQLFAQLALESLVLAAMGGGCGLLVAMWAIDLLPDLLADRLPRAEAIHLDPAVLLMALGATLLTSVLFGAGPALRVRGDAEGLKQAGRGVAGGAATRRLRSGIVIAQVGLAVLVVVAASLLVRSFLTLTSRDPGFEPANLLSFMVQFGDVREPEARARLSSALLERLGSIPGVVAAGASTALPPITPQRATRIEIEGRTLTPAESTTHFIAATPDYFTAIRGRLLRGRAFEPTDSVHGQPVAIVNRALAHGLFAGESPVGRRIRLVNPEHPADWRTIVGVVDDVRYRGFEDEVPPAIYTPFQQTPFMWLYVMVRTDGESAALIRSLGAVVRGVDARLTAADVRPMMEVVSGTVAEPRFGMLLVSGFAALALVLAAIGIYGVIAYTVAQRTREIGLRVALGATSRDVLTMVMREGLLLAGLGTLGGLAAAALVTWMMSDLLVGIGARDPLAYTAGALLLLTLAAAASYLPARHAMRVEPTAALRES